MSDYFLLTYSVNDIGNTGLSKIKTDSVRTDIGALKDLSELEQLSDKVHNPFLSWEKINNVETTFKGLMRTKAGSPEQMKQDAIAKISAVFQEILQEHNARAKTTVIHCGLMTESLPDAIEFQVSYS